MPRAWFIFACAMTEIKKALLFSAGLGTRLKPFTLSHPKALAKVNGKSLLERNIQYLEQAGIEEIIINVHHFANQIKDWVAQYTGKANLIISDESDEVLETGGGLLKAKEFLKDCQTFFVMNVDILSKVDLENMMVYHNFNKADATLAVSDRKSSRLLLFNKALQLSAWKNVQSGEEKMVLPNENLTAFAFSGLQIISSNLLNDIPFTGKFSIIDLYLYWCRHYKIVAFRHPEFILDVGKPESILEAEKFFH